MKDELEDDATEVKESPIKVPAKTSNGDGTATAPAKAKKTKTAAKAKAPAKKAVAKKAAKKGVAKTKGVRKSAVTVETPFRDGSTKAKLFDKISDGKEHKMDELFKICEKDDKSRSLIAHVKKTLLGLKYKIAHADGAIKLTKPAKAA